MNTNLLRHHFSSEMFSWPLVPVCGKRPYHKKWITEIYHPSEIVGQIEAGKATGFGVKLGKGLLAIDFDGDSALQLLSKLSGENNLDIFSQTTSWSSGRPGRKQCLFSVPEKDWSRLRNLRIATGVVDADGAEEFLEFRWLGTQSVLPPSIHPSTLKPYQWINNPAQFPPVCAPEWLINLCESWHSEYAGLDELDLVRFPVRLFPYFGRQMLPWLLARRFDVSRWQNSGCSKGSGVGKFSLNAASLILKRSPGHIRKLLSAAKSSGLIRSYKQRGVWITVFYSSLEKAIALSGIDKLGPIASINIDFLKNIHLIATEVEAQNLQRSSFHLQRREEIEQIKPGEPSGLRTPTQIMAASTHPCDNLARVLGRSERFIFCESGFKFYGGSQEAIAQLRGLSSSTVSRHLSNSYRLAASPVRKFRSELPPISKKQLLERLPLLQNMPANFCREDGLILLGGDWYKPHPNIYLLNHRLVSARRRRAAIHKQKLLVLKISPGDLENNFSLSKAFEEDFSKKENRQKNQEREKQKRS
ncbi:MULTISPECIES: bifunctional DNA primase/polymerase [unclassified Microcoleus]|uniref:bifunctional DNA primase/polymerase n=1 Tax=unclassified Microcoleus TaxID=2642155 RepID=UPI002FD4ADE2